MRVIIHVDVNNAFLSWSAVYRIQNGETKDIRDSYAVIGGDESSRRGIVLAKSNLCKKCGVITGESLYSARRKCPKLEVYPANYNIYRKYSDLMYEYLLTYTNMIERYSIDECFLDYTHSMRLFGDPVKVAYKIKEDIKEKFGFTVNVGVGNNKLEAKMASDFQKPDMVHTLFDYEINKMWKLPIDDLFMLGKSSARKLKELGIYTIGELALYDVESLTKKFKSHGKLMWEYANGIDNDMVHYQERDAKSISASTVLPYDYTNRDDSLIVLRNLSSSVGRKLRNNNLFANSVSIWIKYHNFIKKSKQISLDNSIHTDKDIYRMAIMLFDELWDRDYSIRGLCVGVNQFSSSHDQQLSLFGNKVKYKEDDDKLQKVLDDLQDKYGNDKIGYADMFNNKN